MSNKRKKICFLVITLVILSLISTAIVPSLLEDKGKLGIGIIRQVEQQTIVYEN